MSIQLSYMSQIISEIIDEIGATVWFEPESKIAGTIRFKNGYSYHFGTIAGINTNQVGSIQITKDKGYTHTFLKKFGYPVVEGRTFSETVVQYQNNNSYGDRVFLYAKNLGFPIIIKPNNLSQGIGVRKIINQNDFFNAIQEVLNISDMYRIESFFRGDDYRISVLDGEVICAYQRIPLSIVGNGIDTIQTLLQLQQNLFDTNNRDVDTALNIESIISKLRCNHYTLDTILEAGKQIYLLDNANLSTGGSMRDVTEIIHHDYKNLAINATKDMGLRMCGVDVMTRYPIQSAIKNEKNVAIIEMNGLPGFGHYATLGKKQYQIVKAMYKKILLAIEKQLSSSHE